mmetsp:Transcript_80509/g.227912  ORF Transcript_80509/g.227912 Transcript_80509/m.227912 type:complete len:138 (+) Transcript_80509:68-481(+)
MKRRMEEIEVGIMSGSRILDRAACLEGVKAHWCALLHAPDEFKDDHEIVRSAVMQDGQALMFASERLRADPDLVLEAIADNGLCLMAASSELRNDCDFVMRALRTKSKRFDDKKFMGISASLLSRAVDASKRLRTAP